MSKRGENIYKRKDGRWEGRYIRDRTASGKAIYGYVYAHSYRDTREKLLIARQRKSLLPEEADTAQPADLVTLAEEWFCYMKPFIKESTYMKYQNLWKTYIQPKLGDLQLPEISQNVLETYCMELLASGGRKQTGLSAKTVADTMSLLRSIFRFCANKDIQISCDVRAVTVRQAARKMRVFSQEEQQNLCSHIYSDLCMPNIGILVCLFTGIRVGELCALKWEDISFSEKTIHIHQTMQRIQTEDTQPDSCHTRTKIIVTAPKSPCSIRIIPLPEKLVQILKSVESSGSDYFLTGSNAKWIEPRTMQNHFKRLLKCCDIKEANYHVLRHTFATRCVELGFDIKSLSEILGHASVNITMNRYVHPSMQLKRENMQKLSDLISGEK